MLQAVVLGIVQGLTEFLPVSSSGHLVLAPALFGWEQPTLAFGVALHLGTLVAVVLHFASDLLELGTAALGLGDRQVAERARARRTLWLLALGSLPAAVVGLALAGAVEGAFERPVVAALALYVTAALLVLAERVRRRRAAAVLGPVALDDPTADVGGSAQDVSVVDALVVGGAQALAIVPGVSRAGATIAAGMVRGVSREEAARFSFLLSIPVIAGAGLVESVDVLRGGGFGAFTPLQVAVGTLAATASGWWAVRFLLRLVSTDELTVFAWYVTALATLVLVLLAAGVI